MEVSASEEADVFLPSGSDQQVEDAEAATMASPSIAEPEPMDEPMAEPIVEPMAEAQHILKVQLKMAYETIQQKDDEIEQANDAFDISIAMLEKHRSKLEAELKAAKIDIILLREANADLMSLKEMAAQRTIAMQVQVELLFSESAPLQKKLLSANKTIASLVKKHTPEQVHEVKAAATQTEGKVQIVLELPELTQQLQPLWDSACEWLLESGTLSWEVQGLRRWLLPASWKWQPSAETRDQGAGSNGLGLGTMD